MKTLNTIMISLLLAISLKAQNHIQVSEQTTVHLICPAAVSYVQVGSHDKLLAEAIPDYPNIVRIKAIEAFSDTTSLTLICMNQLYAFQVSYHKHCFLQLKLYDYKGDHLKAQTSSALLLHQIQACIHKLQMIQSNKNIEEVKASKIEFSLEDIRVKQDLLFIKLKIQNHSNLIYRAKAPGLLMRDKRPRKAANVQEYCIEPIQISKRAVFVAPHEECTLVMVFKSFFIPDHKKVEITLKEETEGYTGRDLTLGFGNKAIVNAKAL